MNSQSEWLRKLTGWQAGGVRAKHYPRLIRTFYQPMTERLKQERRRQGINQMELAMIIGCTPSLLAKWEAGIKLPSLYSLLLWSESLGYELIAIPADPDLQA